MTDEVVADDGHIMAGEFAFAVGDVDELARAGASAADGPAAPVPWFQTLARWALLAGLLVAVGGLPSERFVQQRELLLPVAACPMWRHVAPAGGALPRIPIQ